MQGITFATPSLETSAMPKQDQIDVMVNQATASIVCSYLEHMNKALEKDVSKSESGAAFITPSELASLINTVQSALKGI
ncbi:MAG: hypothetical protein QNJ37_13395 [Crocosphaera sp.]|nr:hypothetical protein [Crocosphaera sp.]